MKRDLWLEQIYPYPPSVVWQAVTDPAALGQWLMPVFNFAPEASSQSDCCDSRGRVSPSPPKSSSNSSLCRKALGAERRQQKREHDRK
jgi:hypothetical protein